MSAASVPPPHERAEPVHVRMTPTQRRLFEAEARRYGLTLSAWLRAVAHNAVRQHHAPFVDEAKE